MCYERNLPAGSCPICDAEEENYMATIKITRRFASIDEIIDFASLKNAEIVSIIDLESRTIMEM